MSRGGRGAVRAAGAWSTAVAIALATLAACAPPVTGRAVPVDAVALPAAPGEPAPGITPPPRGFTGRLLESIRLAQVTPVVQEVFPDRLSLQCLVIGDLADPDIVERSSYFPVGTVRPILEKYGYVAGWRSCGTASRTDSSQFAFTTTVMSFELADPAAARAAATELAAASLRSGEQQTTVLDGALAQTSADDQLGQIAEIWVPVGRLIAYVQHRSMPPALDEATRLADLHARQLAAFQPTPQARVAALPADPLGLGALTTTTPGDANIGGGPYDLAATLHTAIDPVADRALLTANGYVGSFRRNTSVTETETAFAVVLDAFPGPAQAGAVRARLVADQVAQPGRGPFTVTAVPDATCYVSDLSVEGASRFTQRCFVTRGGYLARLEVAGVDAGDTAAMSELLATQVDLIDG